MKKLLFIILSAGIFIFQSCDINDIELDKVSDEMKQTTTLALPLVRSHLTIEEMLPDRRDVRKFVKYDKDGFMRLVVEDDVATIKVRDFFGEDKVNGLPVDENGNIKLPLITPISYDVPDFPLDLDFDKIGGLRGFYFENPQITFKLSSKWELPIQFKLSKAYYYIYEDSDSAKFNGSFFTDWHKITVPTDGKPAITNLTLDKNNAGNFYDVISNIPNRFEFGMTFASQPGADGWGKEYTLDLDSENKVSMKVEVPLSVKIDNVLLSDTLDFDTNMDLEDEDLKLENARVHLEFENGLPIEAKIRMFMLDKNAGLLDELTNGEEVITAGNSKEGKNDPVTSVINIDVAQSKIENLKKTKKLSLEITLNTNNYIKLYKQYSLGIKVGLKAKATYDSAE